MAVVLVSTLTIKPDRMEDYVELARRFKASAEKHGARNVRLLAAVVAGEATGTLAFLSEYDDFAASGGVADRVYADPVRMLRTTSTSDSPVASFQMSQWVDILL